ncbi:MAG: hypothetical protein NT067_07525 [Candidatus Diapherotrites archaeon]|nr:hypothetical protein [Candidatus Diapherotrites archaeon]
MAKSGPTKTILYIGRVAPPLHPGITFRAWNFFAGGAETLHVDTPKEGIAIAERRKINLVICDISVETGGRHSALDVLEKINRISPKSHLAISNIHYEQVGEGSVLERIPAGIRVLDVSKQGGYTADFLDALRKFTGFLSKSSWRRPTEIKWPEKREALPMGHWVSPTKKEARDKVRKEHAGDKVFTGMMDAGWDPPETKKAEILRAYVAGRGDLSKREANDMLIAMLKARGEPIPPGWIPKRKKETRMPRPRSQRKP